MERLFISTTPGLEPALESELRALGEPQRVEGGFELAGPDGIHQRACLSLRVAGHVLLRLGEFEGNVSAAMLQSAARAFVADGPVQWQIAADGAAKVALTKSANAAWKQTDDPTAPLLLLRARGGRVTLSIDCAGEPLYRRGYRQEISRAPLRETLAAGILGLARYDGEEPLFDPMCGSGTFLIEGAWIASRRSPGLQRSFAFERWPRFDARAFAALKDSLVEAERKTTPPIVGTDLNAGSLGVARRNARRAGVLERLRLERADATKLSPPPFERPGLVVANLPYGKRVGEGGDLRRLYASFSRALESGLRGWRFGLLIEKGPLEKELRLPKETAVELDNGGIHCWLLLGRL